MPLKTHTHTQKKCLVMYTLYASNSSPIPNPLLRIKHCTNIRRLRDVMNQVTMLIFTLLYR